MLKQILSHSYLICNEGNSFYNTAFSDVKKLEQVFYYPTYLHGLSWINKLIVRLNYSYNINRYIREPFRWYVRRCLFRDFLMKSHMPCLIFIGNFHLHQSLLPYLKQQYPKLRLVLYLGDLVSTKSQLNLDYAHTLFDLIVSYDQADANKYQLEYYPTPYSLMSNIEEGSPNQYDIYFCGKAKNRYDEIIKMYKHFVSQGLKCDFYLYDVLKNRRIAGDGLHYDVPMSYIENIQQLNKSKAILEIMQQGAVGYTPRLWEAIMYNKYLITNNESVTTSSYYSPDSMFLTYEYLSAKRDISKPLVYPQSLKDALSPIYFLSFIDAQLKNKRCDI